MRTAKRRNQPLIPQEDRGPLRVMFVITCMPVGGAETLLVNLIRRLDRSRFEPELCCLKYLGPLGEVLTGEIPVHTGLLAHKYDFAILGRLTRLLEDRRIDAVVTVGTGGDKMFWGRLAGWRASVPVILSALHSTGLPDHVEWPNRLLAPLTDGFIAVADSHAVYISNKEGCPASKVRVIPNGVDTARFQGGEPSATLRRELNLPLGTPVAGIVAALRPEKNHELFLRAAARTRQELPHARFLVVGDGPGLPALKALAGQLNLLDNVSFLGTRHDIPELLGLMDVLLLTSHMEANPVSILEAMACGKPVIATRVGSIPETVGEGITGYLVPPGDERQLASRTLDILRDPDLARRFGRAARDKVSAQYSLERMVEGYQNLISDVYSRKCARHGARGSAACPDRIPVET